MLSSMYRCRGETVPLFGLPPLCRHVCLRNDASSLIVLQRDGLPPSSGMLAGNSFQPYDASSNSSSLEHAVVCYPASFPCIFPVDRLHVQLHDGDGPLCAADPIGTHQA